MTGAAAKLEPVLPALRMPLLFALDASTEVTHALRAGERGVIIVIRLSDGLTALPTKAVPGLPGVLGLLGLSTWLESTTDDSSMLSSVLATVDLRIPAARDTFGHQWRNTDGTTKNMGQERNPMDSKREIDKWTTKNFSHSDARPVHPSVERVVWSG